MAGAPPEGEVWYRHDALKFGDFDPSDPDKFYNTIFLDVGTNAVWGNCQMKKENIANMILLDKSELPLYETHPRADRQYWDASRSYERYKFLTVMTGPSPNKITRHTQIHGPYGRGVYGQLYPEQHEKRFGLVPVMVPTKEERYLWVDLTYPLRAILIPRQHIADPKYYKNYCRYLRLDFTARNATMKSAKGEKVRFETDVTWGWGVRAEWTARIDILRLYMVLLFAHRKEVLSKAFRDPYKLIELHDSFSIDLKRRGPGEADMNTDNIVQYDKLVSVSTGGRFKYEGDDFDHLWGAKCLTGIISAGLSCIPVYGPLLSIGFQLTMDAILSPEDFCNKYKVASDKVPSVTGALLGFAQNVLPMLAKGGKLKTSTARAVIR
ncbi:hypothetical protein BDV25DRAFT_135009 [Aspergillus avenaceus]|uniref:Uncharacterized protein n=1 Tax=Aspergillus avenaceus TaxID=36643 RepID=A0A5N6UAN1_ASPAV|nr:hypothetical protein BDV25DRAFT_135009 [Aspergillus avenaceus]